LPEISYQTLQAVSGAADIPLTRFLGESPGGLNNNGDSDLKNYYDAVNSVQSLEITPALANLDECLIRSALGNRPEEIYFIWSSLWQMSDDKKSQISKETAETIKILVESALFNEADLAVAAGNLLVEHSILPSFKVDETREPEEDEDL
jgi:phage-related protein (TIGR01555 family)